ncbi:thiamine pyrophosphate-binding protein [Metallosphaera javensis (ex Sakai et al. 2022)]|uniref:thiamine pyrophosphate-binding protein n=1 Tax=Metallosphaera javensis (ex Sakai et al. 2022) TaxID=2775498 RepID=UPI0025841D5F|nr:MAG: acetolactate synthase [Metallosphaera javensis (ex Sakai et al. 2022)]
MKGSTLLLELLKDYDVEHVFGLPGETSIPYYPELAGLHVITRDERNAVYMADAYARVSFKPGVVEGPSVGSPYMLPGVIEAYKSSSPVIVITTDTDLYGEKMNMLTSLDQTALFRPYTKDSITVTRADDLSHAVRRAFRLATAGRPGPVHLRIPSHVLEEEGSITLPPQREFSRYPAQRPVADQDAIRLAVSALLDSVNPVLVCGQGALYSRAWDEVAELAELLGTPVGTTITGKGCISEYHPLSIGVVGGRGGTSFSNSFLEEADLVFLVGSNADSANTDRWRYPSRSKTLIQLDVSEAEVGNNYNAISLIGDVKATLREIIKELRSRGVRRREIRVNRKEFDSRIEEVAGVRGDRVNPVRFIKELERRVEDQVIVADPGVGAIYTSALFRTRKAGRHFIFNYGLGGLGYSIPASIGAQLGSGRQVLAMSGDGSFGFSAGELETISRLRSDVVVFLFNNSSYGWIRAEMRVQGRDVRGTDFSSLDYVKIAEGFGLRAYRISTDEDIGDVVEQAMRTTPSLVEVVVEPEDRFFPPVAHWTRSLPGDVKHVY